jgi:hypothetical protein
VKLPVVPALYSIKSVAVIDSVNPSNLTVAAIGVAGRRGNTMTVGSDAGAPFTALVRILSVTSFRAVAAGIKAVMFSVFAVMGVHLVPLVLNSIRFDTPVTASLRVSSAMPVGIVVSAATAGTAMLLMLDDDNVVVALIRTITVTAVLPNALLGMLDPVTDVQDAPLLRLNSIVLETPVIVSVEPLYTAFGTALRAGTVIERTTDVNVISVAFMRN